MTEMIKPYNIKELFSSDSYVIPAYQRNYAWGESEIAQLIQDIVDSRTPKYYVGTLIVWERKFNNEVTYETIDGQQRLTTLAILLSVIKNVYHEIDMLWYKEVKLKFDSRIKSTNTLHSLFLNRIHDNDNGNQAIEQGYRDAKKSLKRILKEFDCPIEKFCNYLFDNVEILRVLVPEDTNLNHYFEIMNSRGEQLEKHEILKVRCLEALEESDRYAFNLIWEACSNMEKYVQYGFDTKQRDLIFGNDNNSKWNYLATQEDVYSLVRAYENSSDKKDEVITKILASNTAIAIDNGSVRDSVESERFNSIINFSNFLLHVLRIQTQSDIALDDKQLIKLFDPFLRGDNHSEFVKAFGYNLLKCKFLFDKYIIKREFSGESNHWSLKRLKWNADSRSVSYVNSYSTTGEDEEGNDGINRELLMLISMFHVSFPTLGYKHWLNAALNFTFNNDTMTATQYKEYLEKLAKAFLYDGFLGTTRRDYFKIVYTNQGEPENKDISPEKLNQGTDVENFVFNYLDYLLWKDYCGEKKYFIFEDRRVVEFEFTIRSSVEHYYPQHPHDISMRLQGNDEKWLNNFGNLCLISSSKNSRLSNFMPNNKKEYYVKSRTIDSIKQRIMMEYKSWGTEMNEIKEHGEKMSELIMGL